MGKVYLARTHTAGLVSVVVVFMVVGLVIDSWTSGRSESHGLAVRRVEVRPPPGLHAVRQATRQFPATSRRPSARGRRAPPDNRSPRCPVLPMRRGGGFRRRAPPPIRRGEQTARMSALAMPSTSACHGSANTGAPAVGSRGRSAASGALKVALPEVEIDAVLAARCLRPQIGGEKRHRVERLGRSVAGHVGVGEDVDSRGRTRSGPSRPRAYCGSRVWPREPEAIVFTASPGRMRGACPTRGRSGSSPSSRRYLLRRHGRRQARNRPWPTCRSRAPRP